MRRGCRPKPSQTPAGGWRASQRYRFGGGWSAFGNVTWLEGAVDNYATSAPTVARAPLSRIMPLTGNLGLRFELPGRKFWAMGVASSAGKADRLSLGNKRDTQRIPPGGTPGYAVFSVYTGWRVRDNLTLTAAVANLQDEDYRIHGSGINEPGRNFIVGAEFKF